MSDDGGAFLGEIEVGADVVSVPVSVEDLADGDFRRGFNLGEDSGGGVGESGVDDEGAVGRGEDADVAAGSGEDLVIGRERGEGEFGRRGGGLQSEELLRL